MPDTDDYRGEHSAPGADGGAPIWDLTFAHYPEDVYGPRGEQYGGSEQGSGEAWSTAVACKNRPTKSVKIYRAVPLPKPSLEEEILQVKEWMKQYMRRSKMPRAALDDGLDSYDMMHNAVERMEKRLKSNPPKDEKPALKMKINPGDWVTSVRAYAVEHGKSSLNNRYKILSKTVPAYTLFTDANSFLEWGYDPVGGKKMMAMKKRHASAKNAVAEDPLMAWESVAEWLIDATEKAQVFSYVAQEQAKTNKDWATVATKLKAVDKSFNDILHTMHEINPEALVPEHAARVAIAKKLVHLAEQILND